LQIVRVVGSGGMSLAMKRAESTSTRSTMNKGETMKTLTHMQTRRTGNDGGRFRVRACLSGIARHSEKIWFCVTFLLFLVMGPFSAIAVLGGLFSLAGEEQRAAMSEPPRL
jgi:hypothetical protein